MLAMVLVVLGMSVLGGLFMVAVVGISNFIYAINDLRQDKRRIVYLKTR